MSKRQLFTDAGGAFLSKGRDLINFFLKTAKKRKDTNQIKKDNEKIINTQTGTGQFIQDKLTRTSRIDAFGGKSIQPKFEKIVKDVQAGERVENTKKAQREIAAGWRNAQTGEKPISKKHKDFAKKFAVDNVKYAIKDEGGAKRVRASKKLGRKINKITEN